MFTDQQRTILISEIYVVTIVLFILTKIKFLLQGRIQDSPQEGASTLQGRWQHTILPKIPKEIEKILGRRGRSLARGIPQIRQCAARWHQNKHTVRMAANFTQCRNSFLQITQTWVHTYLHNSTYKSLGYGDSVLSVPWVLLLLPQCSHTCAPYNVQPYRNPYKP